MPVCMEYIISHCILVPVYDILFILLITGGVGGGGSLSFIFFSANQVRYSNSLMKIPAVFPSFLGQTLNFTRESQRQVHSYGILRM